VDLEAALDSGFLPEPEGLAHPDKVIMAAMLLTTVHKHPAAAAAAKTLSGK
jgi:hypothetical protein